MSGGRRLSLETDFLRLDPAGAWNPSTVSAVSALAYIMDELVDAGGVPETGIYPNPISWGLEHVAFASVEGLAEIPPLAGVRFEFWQALFRIFSRPH